MKKAVLLGDRKAGIIDVPDPHPVKDWAVVKVHAAPMCTEYKAFASGGKAEFLGHEAAGEVVAVAQECAVKPGDRVVVMPLYPCGRCALCVAGDYIHCENGFDFAQFHGMPEGQATMAQYLVKPAWLLPAIPEGVSYDKASLACCALGPSFGAFQSMGLTAFDTVLIAGAGPVGLGAVVNARFRGARVIVAESILYRVERAGQLGAAHVVDPNDPGTVARIKALTDGRGVDCALDCAGYVPAERLCIDATRRKGKVGFIGECGDDLAVRVSPDLLRKGITITGVWHYNLNDFPKIMKVIRESPVIDGLISHVLPMSRIQEAFELSASHQTAKVVLHPWE
ncbi:MAG: zinc-binding dehydrogenase [Candidatus Hydrogenedentes bacterium]|nr:zinc-binding dehydrogenase [Candidatus Hydrogenedentota bacterium]